MARIYANISAQQERFLLVLMASATIAEASRVARVPDSTCRRWLREPAVRAAWLEMRRQAVDMALTAVQGVTQAAVSTLVDCLQKKYPASVRVRAAVALLDTAMRAVELGELAQRVEALEEALGNAQETTATAAAGGLADLRARRYA